ncbi:hypothetical protein KIH74_22700 [Kineosporia sp. J2-2]|uniref:ANTAR domain-containing protein n=1 Tax=Kineosporia corallincola TaxID=2835133 RepID=A0ABS5TKY0_9ACTN|nr:hypothetical protein [Kineosporia corallincola]MBT0771768.1 hypothetical protein [Kineosporia corallincola]
MVMARRPETGWLRTHYDRAYQHLTNQRGHTIRDEAIDVLTTAIRSDTDPYRMNAIADAVEDAINDKETP